MNLKKTGDADEGKNSSNANKVKNDNSVLKL